ncbi:MAG: TonB-dependent receptor plug domain-containing protein [Lewinellaceae bacterium]|nr:TonB-dependent receptor plug domain-containing protein [Lewinellaceae bacterium]
MRFTYYMLQKNFYTTLILLLLFSLQLSAQTKTLRGTVLEAGTKAPLPGVEAVLPSGESATTDGQGRFVLRANLAAERIVVSFQRASFSTQEVEVDLAGKTEVDLGAIEMAPQEDSGQFGSEDLIPTITISTDDIDGVGDQNISGVLTASRDVFVSAAAFVFGPARFRIRGYDSEQTTMLMNGIPVNDPESGQVYWSNWGGLNDVMRFRENSIGLDAVSYSFGGVGGASSFDTRASLQRKQVRLTYSLSNRTYRNRLMATYTTGPMAGGWAVSMSASRRWAQEGYIDGTSYDAWGYFLSVDKKLNEKHSLNLTAFGAPSKRGRSGASVEEMYDLADNKYYNPNWGYQNGEKRNARIANVHQPMAILRHDWQISEKTSLMTSAGYQFGRNGGTALDWYDARDPRPDYYRNLPSFAFDRQRDAIEELLRTSEAARQINWDYMYEVNRNNILSVENANGIPGNTVTGARSQYVVEDRRYDDKRLIGNTILQSNLNEHLTLNGGLTYIWHQGHDFKVLDDLLGGDFYLDVDKFAEFDSTANIDFIQNDVETPNRIVREGDVFGYDYNINIRQSAAWVQADFNYPRVDFFLGGNLGNTTFWRVGNVTNGKFPDNSGGASEKQRFPEYGVKAGFTYKIDGRNYLLLNGGYMTQAPSTREAFVSPRTRNDVAEGLDTRKILSVEGGYLLRAPYAKARVIGYYTQFKDLLWNRSFYLDNAIITNDGTRGGFVNYIMPGVNTQHMGVELAGEFSLTSALKVSAVAALGQYTYTNRPTVTTYLDNVAEKLGSQTVYMKNFYVSGTPQTAYTLGLNYNSPKFWFANLNFNYFDNIWIDFNPARRTYDAISYTADPQFTEEVVEPGSPLWNDIIEQEKAPSAFTVDFFGGKSFKFGKVFLYLNVGVSNILDNRNFITGGYEQLRFDYETKDVDRFPSRYYYAFGRNYFINLAMRI